ncbi:MAG: hypothetical protein ACRCZ2_09445, partial [Fusobacteriaceae bacterium]
NPNQTLKSIRENSLNPVIERVFTVEGNVETLIPKINTAYDNVTFNTGNSKLTFTRIGGGATTEIDLSSIVPVYAGIEVKGVGETGSGDIKNTNKLSFDDGVVVKNGDDYTNVSYNWSALVLKHQLFTGARIDPEKSYVDFSEIDILGVGKKYFKIREATTAVPGTLTIDLPEIPEILQGSIEGKTPAVSDVKSIKVTGNVGGSIINNGILYVDLPSGGGARTTRFFEGFFSSVGDLEAAVHDPYLDRSCAYVMIDSVYVLHMYKGKDDGWKPVKTRATIIYKGQGATPDQGVASIKHDDYIKINSEGELDLSELGKHGGELPAKDFKGIFATVEEIKALKDDLIEDMSYAMLRNANAKNAFSTYYYRKETPDVDAAWNLTPNLGHLVLVEDAMEVGKYKPIYGVKAPSSAFSNKRGVLDLTKGNIKGTIKATISSRVEGVPMSTEDIKVIRFPLGAADAYITGDKTTLSMNPAQMVIPNFGKDWVDAHSTDDYIGKIYYNNDTGRWLGMTDKLPPGKFSKWTTIAHRGMSDQVFSLVNRYPEQLIPFKKVSPTGDPWSVSGRAYLPKDSEDLPPELKDKTGGFLQTDVKMNTAAEGEKPNEIRTQICRPDDGSGGVWQRSYDCDAIEWKPWVKTSFSTEDLQAHKDDPKAHQETFKYYRAYALLGNIKTIFAQQTGDMSGGFQGPNSMLLADSHGYSPLEEYNYLDAPYDGTFNINGVLSFSGYTETKTGTIDPVTLGTWSIFLRKKKKGTQEDWDQAGYFTYEHTDTTKPYPPLFFFLKDMDLLSNQEVVINVNFSEAATLIEKHPYLYLAGSRSNIAIQDKATRAGGAIVGALRKLYGDLDTFGNVGLRAHYTVPETESGPIRTYATRVEKTLVEMKPS